MKACEFGFNLAKTENSEVILLHVYFTPIYASSLPYGDVFNYQIGDEESVKTIIQQVHSDLNALSDKIKEKVASGEFPDIKYSCILREGIPEEEILSNHAYFCYAQEGKLQLGKEMCIDREENE